MKKILYISYDGLTDPLGQSQILPYITGVCKKNEEFYFHIISFEKKERFTQNQRLIQNNISNYNISWHPLPYTKSPPVLSTLKDLLALKIHAKKLHKKEKFAIVHCRSYIPALIGLFLKKKYGVQFIFDMRGFWADERVDGELWNLKNPLYKFIYTFFKQKEKEYLQHADMVISLTHNAKKEMLTWDIPNLHEKKINVIPCAVDFNLFNPDNFSIEDKIRLKQELNIPKDTIILTYLGSIGTWYLLDDMLIFFRMFKAKYPNSIFLFLTNENKERILKKAKHFSIEENNLIIKYVNRNNVPHFLSVSNLGVFFIKPCFSKKASFPVKLGEFLAMKIPIVTNNIGDNMHILQNFKEKYIINNFNEMEFKNKIDDIKFNLPLTLSDELKNYLSLESGIEKYYSIYQSIDK